MEKERARERDQINKNKNKRQRGPSLPSWGPEANFWTSISSLVSRPDWRVVTQDGVATDKSRYDVVENLRDICERSDDVLLPYYGLAYGQCFLDK